MKNISISALVPAYNEEKTIKRVVSDLLKIDLIDEIIITDDGSRDATRDILENHILSSKVKFIVNKENKGKGYSIARGLEISRGELILLLDADILNYTENDLRFLINPVLNAECDYSMKMTDDWILRFTSGVRVYWRKDLIPLIPEMKDTTRYGLEVMLNKNLAHKKGNFVVLKDCHHFYKLEKYLLPQAVWEYTKEGASIFMQIIKKYEYISLYQRKIPTASSVKVWVSNIFAK